MFVHSDFGLKITLPFAHVNGNLPTKYELSTALQFWVNER